MSNETNVPDSSLNCVKPSNAVCFDLLSETRMSVHVAWQLQDRSLIMSSEQMNKLTGVNASQDRYTHFKFISCMLQIVSWSIVIMGRE